MTASEISTPNFIELLIDEGANVNATDEFGSTPLMGGVASNYGSKVVQLLIARGARVNHKNAVGITPFTLAVFYQKNDITKLFLTSSLDVDELNSELKNQTISKIKQIKDVELREGILRNINRN